MKTALSHVILIVLVIAAAQSASDAAEILYTGTCHNVTFGAEGLLKLYIVETDKGLEGYMSISGFLFGSGNLRGTHEGNQFKFHTTDSAGGIDWQGTLQGAKLSGEYFVPSNQKLRMPRQVGEWEVKLTTKTNGKVSDGESFRQLFMMRSEIDLNGPMKLPDGTMVWGAQAIFKSVHPFGTGLSVNVTDAQIEWNDGTAHTDIKDIHRYTLDYVLFWQGPIQPTGWTRLRLTYNAILNTVTANDVIESTGTTNKEAGDIAYGIGFLLGKAAVESLMNSK